MDLQLDSLGNVTEIKELLFDGTLYDVKFVDGSVQHIKDIGRITQQCAQFPVIACSLQNALRFAQEISKALGEGPDLPGVPNPVKSVGCTKTDQWKFCFYDTAINLYDVIEYVKMVPSWINDGGAQLSESNNPDPPNGYGDKIPSFDATITLVTPSTTFKLVSPIGLSE